MQHALEAEMTGGAQHSCHSPMWHDVASHAAKHRNITNIGPDDHPGIWGPISIMHWEQICRHQGHRSCDYQG